jgi:hypothetical protein
MSSKWKVVRILHGKETATPYIKVNLFQHELQAIGYAQALNEFIDQANALGGGTYKAVEVPDETYWEVTLQVKVGRWDAKPDYNDGLNNVVGTNLGYVVWHRVLAKDAEAAILSRKMFVLDKWCRDVDG